MLRINQKLKLIVSSLALFGYLSVLTYIPIHMIEMANMNMPMEHCPFMDNNVLCTMSISEHIREWQSWGQYYLPFFNTLTIASTFVVFSILFLFSTQILQLLLYYKRQRKLRIVLFLQELFSRGILHSKVY